MGVIPVFHGESVIDMAGECVLASLRGKIISAPEKQEWRLQYHDDEASYVYTYEQKKAKWTPMNSNLHMQGIKVQVHNPVPVAGVKGNSTESTLMLLEIMKENKRKENRAKKDEIIRKMALEQKQRKQQKERPQNYFY